MNKWEALMGLGVFIVIISIVNLLGSGNSEVENQAVQSLVWMGGGVLIFFWARRNGIKAEPKSHEHHSDDPEK